MPEKTIDGYLVVDWKDGTHRTRQSKPSRSELRTNELLAELEIDVTIPDVDVPTLALEIDVPEPQVFAATLDALADEDLPDWAETANEVVDREQLAIEHADGGDVENLIDRLTARTLIEDPGRPDAEIVREYIDDVVEELREVEQ